MLDPATRAAPRKEGVALATLGALKGTQVPNPIQVHFNPVSLQLAINNQVKKNQTHAQYIATTTMKLTMDLIFDSTDTGQDVTDSTRPIQALLGPETHEDEDETNGPPPPKVRFEWGTITFDGIIEAYKETIDFFSIDGVPLRSSVNLTLSRPDRVFEKATGDHVPKGAAVGGNLRDAPAQSAAALSNKAQAPGAARALAEANGQKSIRFGSGGPLTVGGSVQLKPAVAFSSGGGGAGLSLGGGGGLSLGGGLNAGGGLGFSAGGSAGASVSASAGISGLARLSATEGAFSGLRISTRASGAAKLDLSMLAPKISGATAALDAAATFQVGGKATMQRSGGLRAEVGASGKLSFDAG